MSIINSMPVNTGSYVTPSYTWESEFTKAKANSVDIPIEKKYRPTLQIGPKVTVDPITGEHKLVKEVDPIIVNEKTVVDNPNVVVSPYKFINKNTPTTTTDITEFTPTTEVKNTNADKTKVVPEKGNISTVEATNIISGINTFGNVISNVIGAVSASKMKPTLIGYSAPIETKLIDDNTEQIKAGAQESIDRQIAGAKDVNRRYGKSVTGDILAKSLSAENELSSKLAESRKAIDAQNVQMENQMSQYNDQQERNRNATNAQIQTQFDIQKSGILGNAIQGISTALTGGAQSIIDNMMYGKNIEYASYRNDLSALNDKLDTLTKGTAEYTQTEAKINELNSKIKDYITKTYQIK